MANATAKVAKGTVRWTDEFAKRGLKTLTAETTYYTGAMMGLNVNGYLDKFDDAASMIFQGLVRGREGNPVMAIATQADAGHDLDLHRPKYFELAITGVVLADVGKKVYASDDQTGVLTNGGTYGNFVGTVFDRVYASSGTPVANIALVEAAYGGLGDHERYGVSKTLAATGAQTLTKWDIGKTILIPNTAAYSITLPAIADTQAGDRIHFVKTTSDAFAATLDGNAAELIDGAATLATIDAQWDTATLVSYGTAWAVEYRDIA